MVPPDSKSTQRGRVTTMSEPSLVVKIHPSLISSYRFSYFIFVSVRSTLAIRVRKVIKATANTTRTIKMSRAFLGLVVKDTFLEFITLYFAL